MRRVKKRTENNEGKGVEGRRNVNGRKEGMIRDEECSVCIEVD